MPRGHIRSALDVSKVSSLVQRPGIDPRINLSLGVVSKLGFDAAYGIFADVQLIPSGETETCLVGATYAGSGFGQWAPLRVDDTVVVAIPHGDPNHGPVIVQRLWNSGDPPSADFKNPTQDDNDDVPSDDWVLRVRPGQKLTLRLSDDSDAGTMGSYDLKVEGDGTLAIETDGTGAMTLTATGDGPITVEGKGSGDVSVNQSGSGAIVVHQSGSSGNINIYSDAGVVNLGGTSGTTFALASWDDLITYLNTNNTNVGNLRSLINQNIMAGTQLNVVGEAALVNPGFPSLSPNMDMNPTVPSQSTKVKSK